MADLQGTPILITGGAGFIGAALTHRLLEAGARIHLIIRPGTDLRRLAGVMDRVSIHRNDLLDAGKVREVVTNVRPHWIFHLAARRGHPRTPEERLELLRSSFVTTAHLLEAARDVGITRFIHMGSSLEYGPYPRAIRERDPLRPTTDRGVAKAVASLLVAFYAHAFSLPAIILRPFYVYGPGEPPEQLIPTLLRAALTGEEVRLTTPGYRHDFVFVEDVVEACLRAATRSVRPGEAFNIGTGIQWANEEVAALVESITGRPLRLRIGTYPPSPPDTSCWVADIRKAQRRLRWSPRWDLPAGLRRTLEWMQRHGDPA
ncbi:MAG: NAD-dependent epimerase/dehydratase family protein [Armatimonadota bacterium]|nr:NAD-dependent epimerase/dehydratase family protein [Armatimonadota bacterium]